MLFYGCAEKKIAMYMGVYGTSGYLKREFFSGVWRFCFMEPGVME